MEVAAIILPGFFVLLFLWMGTRELWKALLDIKTVTRLQQFGVQQQGTIVKIEFKKSPPLEYGEVLFRYTEKKTTCMGKQIMSVASARTLMKEDREVVLSILPSKPRSARVERTLTDHFERKRALIMGCALCVCGLLSIAASVTSLVLGLNLVGVAVLVTFVFTVGSLIVMGIAFFVLRFFLKNSVQ